MTLFRRHTRNSNSHAGMSRSASPEPLKYTINISTRSLLKWVFGISLGMLLFLIIGVSLFQIYHYVTTSDYFIIRNITVTGTRQLTKDEILKLSGISCGINSFSVSMAKIEKNIYKNQWISNVSIKRSLPDTFEIHITEHQPAFWILSNDTLYYADINGTLIDPVQADKFISLPILEIPNGEKMPQADISRLLQGLKDSKLPIDMRQASTVRLSESKGIEIIMGNDAISVHIQAEEWEENLVRLKCVLNDLARRGELKSVREVWVSDGNAWVVSRNHARAR